MYIYIDFIYVIRGNNTYFDIKDVYMYFIDYPVVCYMLDYTTSHLTNTLIYTYTSLLYCMLILYYIVCCKSFDIHSLAA